MTNHNNVIVQFREKHGLTQAELCKRWGVSQPTVSAWENGKIPVHIEKMVTELNQQDNE
nr:hypothetical protein 23 [bacterium]